MGSATHKVQKEAFSNASSHVPWHPRWGCGALTTCLFSCLLRLLAHECHRLAPSRLQLPPSPPCHPRRRCSPLRFPDAHDTLTRNFPRIVWFLRMATAVATPVNFAPRSRLPAAIGASAGLLHSHDVCSESMLWNMPMSTLRSVLVLHPIYWEPVNWPAAGTAASNADTNTIRAATPAQRCCRRKPLYRQRLFRAVGSPRLEASARLRHLILPRRTWLHLFAVTVTSQCFAGCSVNSDLVSGTVIGTQSQYMENSYGDKHHTSFCCGLCP